MFLVGVPPGDYLWDRHKKWFSIKALIIEATYADTEINIIFINFVIIKYKTMHNLNNKDNKRFIS
jgi:hypothetical protein